MVRPKPADDDWIVGASGVAGGVIAYVAGTARWYAAPAKADSAMPRSADWGGGCKGRT